MKPHHLKIYKSDSGPRIICYWKTIIDGIEQPAGYDEELAFDTVVRIGAFTFRVTECDIPIRQKRLYSAVETSPNTINKLTHGMFAEKVATAEVHNSDESDTSLQDDPSFETPKKKAKLSSKISDEESLDMDESDMDDSDMDVDAQEEAVQEQEENQADESGEDEPDEDEPDEDESGEDESEENQFDNELDSQANGTIYSQVTTQDGEKPDPKKMVPDWRVGMGEHRHEFVVGTRLAAPTEMPKLQNYSKACKKHGIENKYRGLVCDFPQFSAMMHGEKKITPIRLFMLTDYLLLAADKKMVFLHYGELITYKISPRQRSNRRVLPQQQSVFVVHLSDEQYFIFSGNNGHTLSAYQNLKAVSCTTIPPQIKSFTYEPGKRVSPSKSVSSSRSSSPSKSPKSVSPYRSPKSVTLKSKLSSKPESKQPTFKSHKSTAVLSGSWRNVELHKLSRTRSTTNSGYAKRGM